MKEHPMDLDQAHAICAAIFEPARGQELEHAARAALAHPARQLGPKERRAALALCERSFPREHRVKAAAMILAHG